MNEKQKQIHERVAQAVRQYNLSHSQLFQALTEAYEEKVYLEFGCTNLFQYAVKIHGLTEGNAQMFNSVVKKAQTVSKLKEEIVDGKLDISKVARVVSVITPENQNEWIEKIESLPKSELEKEVAKVSPSAVQRETLRRLTEDKISFTIHVTNKELEEIKRAQEILSSKKRKAVVSTKELLLGLVEDFLKKEDPIQKADRAYERAEKKKEVEAHKRSTDTPPTSAQKTFEPPKSSKSFSEQRLERADSDPTNEPQNPARAEASPQIQQEEAEMAGFKNPTAEIPEKENAGGIVEVDQTRRPQRERIPAKVLHEVHRRDRGQCCYKSEDGETCGSRFFTEIHHIQFVSQGGKNIASNLITLIWMTGLQDKMNSCSEIREAFEIQELSNSYPRAG